MEVPKQNQSLLNWSFLASENYEDPVFEGIVRDFYKFDKSLLATFDGVDRYMLGVQQMSEGMVMLSDEMVSSFVKGADVVLTNDVIRYRECTHKIGRIDAPISSISKLQRDLENNVVIPIQSHLANNKDIKRTILLRRKRLNYVQHCQMKLNHLLGIENTSGLKIDEGFRAAERIADLSHSIPVKLRREIDLADQALELARQQFKEVDRPLFEWLMMLEAYKWDLYDSLLQTIKYLQFEYFSGCSQLISPIMPPSMHFRPLVEMTPEELKPQVDLELDEYAEDAPIILDVTANLLKKWDRDSSLHQYEETNYTPDPLSLSSLISQGFDEELCIKALRLHHNDTQAALEVLLNNPDVLEVMEANENKVRHPTSLKWTRKLNAFRKNRAQSSSSSMVKHPLRGPTSVSMPHYPTGTTDGIQDKFPLYTSAPVPYPSNYPSTPTPPTPPHIPEIDLFTWDEPQQPPSRPHPSGKKIEPTHNLLDDMFSFDDTNDTQSPSLDILTPSTLPNSLSNAFTLSPPAITALNQPVAGKHSHYKSDLSTVQGKGIGNLTLPGEIFLSNFEEEFEQIASKDQKPIPDIYQLNFQVQTNGIDLLKEKTTHEKPRDSALNNEDLFSPQQDFSHF